VTQTGIVKISSTLDILSRIGSERDEKQAEAMEPQNRSDLAISCRDRVIEESLPEDHVCCKKVRSERPEEVKREISDHQKTTTQAIVPDDRADGNSRQDSREEMQSRTPPSSTRWRP